MRKDCRTTTASVTWRLTIGIALLAAGIVLTGPAVAAQEHSAGLVVSDQPTPQDAGLPSYPGAKPHKRDPNDKNDSDSARMGLWGGGYGLKLVVVSMESSDPPKNVARFYEKALAKYGKVLDCTESGPKEPESDSASDSVTCDNDKPDKGGMLFKAGTRQKLHLVAVKPNGTGTLFQLVYLFAGGS